MRVDPGIVQGAEGHQERASGEGSGTGTPGLGQSKSSRRRRRKRKGKGAEGSAADSGDASYGAEPGASEGVVNLQASGPSNGETRIEASSGARNQPASHGAGFAQGANGSTNGTPGGTKRWKKKFRERDRDRPRQTEGGSGFQNGGASIQGASSNSAGNGAFAAHHAANGQAGGYRDRDTHQPGNNAGGFKRKGGGGFAGKQQGGQQGRQSRGFVGPMDHSYRAVNGNFVETPPSTIEPRSNFGGRPRTYQGDSQPIDYSQGRAIPIASDAPTRIYFFIEDLFFVAKIQETARKLGVKVAFVKNDKESLAMLLGGEEADRPGLIVVDLNNANAKPLTLVPKLKAKLKRSTSVVGFLSHLQGDLKAKAVEAGCDTVMPRAAFSQNLPNLLRRYGIEEAEDHANFNQ